jgi:glycosyltransferase involved in cell wall biosynthesis
MQRKLTLLIDASNINAGGGVTHLSEFLRASNPSAYSFEKVIVWAPQKTLDSIEDKPWLIKKSDSILEKSYLHRAIWQSRHLERLARSESCDLILVPGGTFVCKFRPIVTMSQNLLPFENAELFRYKWSSLTLKFLILRLTQTFSFRRANGIIFSTEYSRKVILEVTDKLKGVSFVIPLGIDNRFFNKPRIQYPIDHYCFDKPFKILYVSTIEPYKHQISVVNAITKLRAEGFPVVLDLIGSAYPPALRLLEKRITEVDADGLFINYLGLVPHSQLQIHYLNANLCVFASTCESFGQILLEGMASGLPTACSCRSAMPEILGDAGIYFDPEDVESIIEAIREFITSADLLRKKAEGGYRKARNYSWNKYAHETFSFLEKIVQKTA